MNTGFLSKGRILTLLLILSLVLPVAAGAAPAENAPYVETFSKSADPGAHITFSKDDFTSHVIGDATLEGIVITSLPAPELGLLCYGERSLLVGEAVIAEGLDSLYFSPATADEAGANFSFIPVFSGETGRNTVISVSNLKKTEHAPTVSDAEYQTIKNIAVTCEFKGSDADGDVLIYHIVEEPKKGVVSMSEDTPNKFIYTPTENKTGTDYFTYIAEDPSGRKSDLAKITIKITKNGAKMTYADMDGNPAHFAALKLAEEGVLIGQRVGDNYYFEPAASITRGDFVAMALTCLGTEVVIPVSKTGFADDDATPAWVKPYASAALKNGIISGVLMGDGRVEFRSAATLTRAEAAVMLTSALDLKTAVSAEVFGDMEDIPAWAEQSVKCANAKGLLSTSPDGLMNPNAVVTRAEAAEMLWRAMELKGELAKPAGLLSRVFG